jgi:6-pyruvoyltetrahydropterin/6-carboxytetrahydropterin synthase
MITCSKTWPDIPLAHRQHRHAGHCRYVHGHSWTIRATFSADALDAHGFVVDFGALKYLKRWIDEHLDHAIMLGRDDPLAPAMIAAAPDAFKVVWVETASAEGLAQHVYEAFAGLVQRHEDGRVRVTRIEVWEDPRNMVTYEPKP